MIGERHCCGWFMVRYSLNSMSNALRSSESVPSATRDTTPWRKDSSLRLLMRHFTNKKSCHDWGDMSFSSVAVIGAILVPTGWNTNGTYFRHRILQCSQDVEMQMAQKACLHQFTLEDSPRDYRRKFTRKCTKNSWPGGELAGLGFLLLYT